MTPFKSRSSRSSGIAVISFDFSSVFICPKHTPSLEAHALTMWTALCPVPFPASALYPEPRSVFPSKATTSPSLILFPKTDFAYSMNTFPSCPVSIFASTRRIVSALGMPFARMRYFFSTFLLSSAYKCIDSMLLYPQSTPKNTIISISTRLCFLHLSIRLSFIVSRDSFKFISSSKRILLFFLIFKYNRF